MHIPPIHPYAGGVGGRPARTHPHTCPNVPTRADARPHPWTQVHTGARTHPCPPQPTTWTPARDMAPTSIQPWTQDLTAAIDAPARFARPSPPEPNQSRDPLSDRHRPRLRLRRPIRHRLPPTRPKPIEIDGNRLARALDR